MESLALFFTPGPTTTAATGVENTSVINLATSFQLSQKHINLLQKGLSFIPTSTIFPDRQQSTKGLVQKYHRRLKLISYYGDSPTEESPPFQNQSLWEPKNECIPPELIKLIEQDNRDLSHLKMTKETPNLTPDENQALRELQALTNIVIKPADKGSAVVIMDRKDYVFEALRQLQDPTYYRQLDTPIYPQTTIRINHIIDRMYNDKILSFKQTLYLKGQSPPRPRYFYLLPKIHKSPESWTIPHRTPTGRPIVSDCSSESYGTAEWVDYFLNPLSTIHPSYVKDTGDFINKVRTLSLPPDCFLFTMDVDSLYTNIDTERGLQAIGNLLTQHPDPSRPDHYILELLRINLECNDFQFDGKYYLQTKGTAMGKRFSPAYANIYMADWEDSALKKCPKKPIIYLRYIDDIWGIWNHPRPDFEVFLRTLNSHHESIKLKATIHDSEVNFLDTTTFKGPNFLTTGILDTRVYFKPTDTHALLHKSSFHPKHTFKGLVHSQLLRFHRNCSLPQDVDQATKTLFKALRHRGYSRTFLRNVRKKTRAHINITPTPNEAPKPPIPLISVYSSYSVSAHRRLKRNFQHILPEHLFRSSHRVISSFKKNPNLGDLLTRAKLPPLRTKNPPRQHLGPPTAPNTTNGTRFLIQPDLNLGAINCVYLIWCKCCQKQYVGETGNSLRTRLHAHRYNVRNGCKLNTHLVQHFLEHGHQNLMARAIESRAGWTPQHRRRAEAIWIKKLNTRHPHGLNEN